MDEFTKTKITFALALAGIALAINPLVTSEEAKGIVISGFKIQSYYYFFICVLGVSVYAYAWDFVSEKSFPILHKVGGFFYTFSIVIPLAIILIWLTDIIFKFVPEDKQYIIDNAGMALSIVIGVISGLISKKLSKSTQDKEEEKNKEYLMDFIIDHLIRIDRKMVSFNMLRRKTGFNYTDEWFGNLIKDNAELFQPATLKGGTPGVKYERYPNTKG